MIGQTLYMVRRLYPENKICYQVGVPHFHLLDVVQAARRFSIEDPTREYRVYRYAPNDPPGGAHLATFQKGEEMLWAAPERPK